MHQLISITPLGGGLLDIDQSSKNILRFDCYWRFKEEEDGSCRDEPSQPFVDRYLFLEGRLVMKAILFALAVGLMFGMCGSIQAGTVTFGSGSNRFQMEFVTIGNPGNAADTTGDPSPAGAVAYEYGIGKFEVSRDMIIKFNASQEHQVYLSDMSAYGANGANKPATGPSWNQAARFVNWLNTSTGGFAAYNFVTNGLNDNITPWTSSESADYDPSNRYRSKRAKYVLPSYNEWYKAAYYDPYQSIYYSYTTGSNVAPTPVASGTAQGTAVYAQPFSQGPADVHLAGGLSPYGVMGLGGNVTEWEESSWDVRPGSYNIGFSARGMRGGVWNDSYLFLLSSMRWHFYPDNGYENLGFRVAMVTPSGSEVPEPSMMLIGSLFGLGGIMAKRRMRGLPVLR